MAHGDSQPAAEHAFDVVLRGYDRRQVDDHIAALESRLHATGRECSELRMQRDAEASRARGLEGRIRDGGSAPAAPVPAAAPASPAGTDSGWSFEGLGAKVESILRVAAEEADSIRRAAADSVRKHTDAESRLRTTFESIASRLQPLMGRLEDESATAQAAVGAATNEAGALEGAARQQAQAMIDAAAATAARMRADAETRVEITARQVADVREELALVRQLLSGLDPTPGSGAAPAPQAAADTDPGTNGHAEEPVRPRGSGGTVRVPALSGARLPQPSAMEQTGPVRAGGNGAPMSLSKPGADRAMSPAEGRPTDEGSAGYDAPTETIALPPGDFGTPPTADQGAAPHGQHQNQS